MQKPKWYSPKLSRDLVSRLYHRAKAEGIPMTQLANQIIGQALGKKERISRPEEAKTEQITQPN